MLTTFKFGRLDSTDQVQNFHYGVKHNGDATWYQRDVEMCDLGAHMSVTIRNYMREPLLIVDNLRSDPKVYESIYASDKYMLEDTTNYVIIDIRMRENDRDKNGNSKIKTQRHVEIRCPGHLLQTNSLFVEELGCYLTISSRLEATRELIIHDTRFGESKAVSVPEALVKPDPVSSLRKFEPLLKNCFERADRIQVRVGVKVDKDPSSIPDKIRNLRIAVMDRDFSPFHSNRMVYDPTLTEDEFVVENLHFISSEPLISTFARLHNAEGRAFFVDTKEHRTMGGTLCGLAIFADPDALHEYLFAHKAETLYEELIDHVSNRDGNPSLRKKIDHLQTEIANTATIVNDLNGIIAFERGQVKDLKRINAAHEETIKKIQANHEAMLSYDSVMQELENEREKIAVDREKLEFERIELETKQRASKQTYRASIIKAVADGLKSTWGILVIIVTIGTAIFKSYNKLKSVSV